VRIATRRFSSVLAIFAVALLSPLAAGAAVITFDTIFFGETSFGFDGDADGVDDVIFSTTDPFGFFSFGPGVDQNFIDEPGLEGTTFLNPDLRVDFLNGAVGSIAFGFALNSSFADPALFASLQLFDASDALIASATVPGEFTMTPGGVSDFPEGRVVLPFAGVASYGLFDFSSEFGRYIIDNFEGDFGSAAAIPEPATAALLGLGIAALGAIRRRNKSAARRVAHRRSR